MITKHCRQRMNERKITENDLIKSLRDGKWGRNWRDDNTRLISYKNIRVVVCIKYRDILTCWKEEK